MNLSELFIRRPVMTVLLNAAIVVAGVIGYQNIPVSALPSYDTAVINVSAALPGANPDTMASSVALPLEKQFQTVPGLKTISSNSILGLTQLTLEFEEGRDIDAAAVDVQAALLRAQRTLPVELTEAPSYRKVNPADAPVLLIALTSPSLAPSDLQDYAEHLITPQLSTISGVAQVNIFGAKRYAVRVRVMPEALAARNIGLDELSAALRAANVNTPVGTLDGPRQTLVLQANQQLRNAAEFSELIVSNRGGNPVLLKDVARVEDSIETLKSWATLNGENSITIAVLRQPGANTVQVVDAVRALLPKLQSQMPQSVLMTPINDRSTSVRAALHDVTLTLMGTIALVVLVIFLFLRRFVATAIPILSLPVSLIGAVALLWGFGYSLDNISLLGLTLAVGLVVDDAIVVLENIMRHIEEGVPPFRAALLGAREVGFTIIAISSSLIAVFIPLLFMSGLVGRMFREFALTLTIAVVTSAIVSLTLTPMMCSRLLKRHGDEFAIPGLATLSGWIDRMVEFYHRTLLWVLKRQRATLIVTFATIVATLLLYIVAPKGFLPLQDTASITAVTEAGPEVSFSDMQTRQMQAAEAIKADPDVIGVVSVIGAGSVNPTTNVGRLVMTLKPRGERKADISAVIVRLKSRVASIPA